MKTTQKGLDLIKKFEGFRSTEYFCLAGKRTIGYGHVLKISEKYSVITEEQAEELLRQDVASIEYFINKTVTVPLTQGQFDALVSLAYNWGIGNLAKSKGIRKLNNYDYAGALEEFKEVNKVGGKVIQGLVNRRNAEAELWNDKA